MTEQMDVLFAVEPVLFDTVNKTLNTNWVDWYIVTAKAESKQALVAGNARLKDLQVALEDVDGLPGIYLGKQIDDLVEDVKGYFSNFNVITQINQNGWLEHVEPSDPSIFATEGDGFDLRAWAITRAASMGVNKYGIRAFIQSVYGSLSSIDLKTYAGEPEPALESIVNDTPSLLWVLDYAARNKVDLDKAHNAGVALIKEKANENPGAVVPEENA